MIQRSREKVIYYSFLQVKRDVVLEGWSWVMGTRNPELWPGITPTSLAVYLGPVAQPLWPLCPLSSMTVRSSPFHLDLWGVGSKGWKGCRLIPGFHMDRPSSLSARYVVGKGVKWAGPCRVECSCGRRFLPDVEVGLTGPCSVPWASLAA